MLQRSNLAAAVNKVKYVLQINPLADERSADTLASLAGPVTQAIERLTSLNVQVLKTLLTEATAGTQAMFSARTPLELAQLQAAALKAAPQKAMAYSRHVLEIVLGAMGSQGALIGAAQVANTQAAAVESVSGATKAIPGFDGILAPWKAAWTAGQNAYDALIQGARQQSRSVPALGSGRNDAPTESSSLLAITSA